MGDLDRHEEYAREQRQAGGPYAPEYDLDVDYLEMVYAPPMRRVPAEPHIVDRLTQQQVEIVEYTTWAPSWEPERNWSRDVLVRRTHYDGRVEIRQIALDRLAVRAYRLVRE